jgi:5-methylcytosine-specific restriction endonuclease McrA
MPPLELILRRGHFNTMPTGVYRHQLLSEEHKRKIGNALRGRKQLPFSEETKRKLSESHKGLIPWIKGKHHTNESKRKMSESRKGKHHSEETKRKLSISHKGHLVSIETRQKISKRLKGIRRIRRKSYTISEHEKLRKCSDYKLWHKAVLERDNFTCQKCGQHGGDLVVHHINNFAEFPELRFALDNGITLCETCHKKFHKIYGENNNTKEQLNEFLEV